MHWLRKLRRTVAMLTTLGMARMFGHYIHSVGGGEFEYAVYEWRGKQWGIPTTPLLGEER